jgi:choline dehydrogenase-like flavoprotein
MTQRDHYDIIIIGSGAGGGTLAAKLAPSGKRILIIERGGFLPRERENWDTRAVFEQQRYLAKDTWYDKHDEPFSPYTHYWVGGNTKVYGAALLRMREHDFGEIRHYGGVSPAWPLSYADLEPYYTEAERVYSAHGLRGADPCEPPASEPYPFEPVPYEPRMAELATDLRAVGANPFPAPLGVRLGKSSPRRAPYHLGAFDGYPDPTEVKADAHVVGVASALQFPNVSILTDARVERLDTDWSGREVSSVIVEQAGNRLTLSADLFVVSCGAINSAALLLRSANAHHPNGLANSSGLVGRHYMCHHNGLFIAVGARPNPSAFQKAFAITDFYRSAPDSPLPLGTIQLMGKPDPGALAWARADKLPGQSLEEIATRTIDFFLTSEDLPDRENRVTLRDDGAIRLSYTPNNLAAYDHLERKIAELLDAVDRKRGDPPSTYLTARLGISGVSHQNGTLRFGVDSSTSVLDLNCRAHDLDNLYVVDASFFPSSSAVNPSLTIMANSLRVGDHILSRLGANRCVACEETV